jgi:two-component system, OmpR family, phosphate regulon sensor histidine kinase PhoR
VAGLSSLVAGIFLHRAIGRHVAGQISDRLTQDARAAADLFLADSDPEHHADALTDRLGADLGVRVTFVEPGGKVLGDSDLGSKELAVLENHSDRPEIREALRRGHGSATRESATLGVPLLYVARKLEKEGRLLGVVRVAIPLTEVRRAQHEVRLPLLAGSVLTMLASVLLGWLAARGPARRLEEMSRIASEIASGNSGARVAPAGGDEIARVGRSLNRMADQLEERLSHLTRDRKQLMELLDAMVEGVLLTDGRGRIQLANRAFETIFRAAPPLQGLRPLEAARIPALQEAVEAVLHADEAGEREIVLPGPEEKALRASLAPIREGSRTVGAVLVFHDVTELKSLEKVRREFVANVSHELRTPLTAIRGYAETLRDGTVTDPRRIGEFAEVIHRNARRLQALIEDLLDLSSVEQGKSRMEIGRVPLAEAVEQVVAVVGPVAARKRHDFRVSVPDTLPPLLADKDRLAQVLINLLDNAMKFTPEGGRVSLSAEAANGTVVIHVRDNGVGIPPEDLPRIFERFYRVDRSRDRKEGGTGLGLAIAKHLTVAMGGKIEVRSTPGTGTEFRISFPSV